MSPEHDIRFSLQERRVLILFLIVMLFVAPPVAHWLGLY
jgi:hypothetical protein